MAPLALDIFVGVVHLLADAGEMKRAVELLVLAEQHEASTFETKERARHLLAELAAQLPPGEFEAAQALGQQKELWTAHTHELLVEMARWE
jgi:hypothetical protein